MPDYMELGELLDSLFGLKDELIESGDWAASKALDEILNQRWIDAWYG